ncbi:MAG: toprim domain-containing protein [Dysgonomonas mossii]|nr:toprim domain-containing protein [Dysgonomonas mossii]
MTIEQAKNIAIEEYLQSCGITPVKRQGNNLWYLSPLRTESEPSFKVNQSRNEWYDFGLGRGGDIIQLAMVLHGTDSVSFALKTIEDNTPLLKPLSFSFRQQEAFEQFEDITIKPLANAALLQFLNERQIPTSLAQQFCQEVYYKHNNKPYFAIAFRNELGGYELRNKYFKGCFAPKALTAIENGKTSCCIFEGTTDFLSYLVLRLRHNPDPSALQDRNYFILNSVNNTSKILDRLEKYEHIYCYLDNDEAGKRSVNEICQRYGIRVSDQSSQYREYKDLNDYLCGKKIENLQKIKHENSLSNCQVSKTESEQPKPTLKPIRRMKL